VEQLKTDLSALLALCKKTDNDIRSCLSTLQFFRKRGKQLRASDVAGASVGAKDASRSLFSVWESLFTMPRPEKVNPEEQGAGSELANSVPARYRNILGILYSSGEYEKIVSGVFENYLSVKFKDSGMQGVVAGLEWIVHFDLLHQEAIKSQAWALMGHFSFPLVAAHLLFASTTRQRIAFPVQQAEATARRQRAGQMLDTVTGEMEPTARAYSGRAVLLREVLPTILSVVQPSLRPVNTQLFTAKEKAELANVVAVHIAYNITYQQERNPESGQYEYRMEPDVEGVVCFPGQRRAVTLSYGTKQLISHEVELEKMRRIDAAKASVAPEGPASQPEGLAGGATPKGAKRTFNHLATLAAKPVEVKPTVATDFFGRPIKVPVLTVAEQAKKSESDLVKSDIWFKFKEGYSNAVRRTVKMKDLL
jgi:chromosome transmission fidelity protein 18